MTDSRSQLPDMFLYELHSLVDALLSGEPSDRQLSRLEQLVCEDPEFRAHYVQYLYTSWNLRAWAKHSLSSPAADQLQPFSPDADSSPFELSAELRVTTPQNSPPLQFLSTTLHGTFGYLSSGWPVAYLVATVIFAIGALVGSLVYVSQPAQVARAIRPSALSSLLSPLGGWPNHGHG